MKKVLIIGASGMVAGRFIELSKDKLNITGVDEKTLDITNKSEVENYFRQNYFDAVVNFAAYTDTAKAESERGDENGIVWRLNVEGPKNLAEACKSQNIFFVQISTDFVFEGLKVSESPFDEDKILPDNPTNLSWYGWTKNRGEVGDAIVRIANPFLKKFDSKLDFARKILDLYDKQSLFPLFTDQIITPIFVDDMVAPLVKIIEEKLPGKFHLVSADTCSYYDFGNYLLEKARGVKDFPKKASLVEFLKDGKFNKRPIFGGLNTLKTQKSLNMQFKTWKQMVDEFVI